LNPGRYAKPPQDPAAALALVSARAADVNSQPTPGPSEGKEEDADLQRAKDLIELHYSIKVAGEKGDLERILRESRSVVRELGIGKKE
jgi:hypothetical protein